MSPILNSDCEAISGTDVNRFPEICYQARMPVNCFLWCPIVHLQLAQKSLLNISITTTVCHNQILYKGKAFCTSLLQCALNPKGKRAENLASTE